MIQIFISYAREDYQAVRQLYNRLKSVGYQPWMDKVDLPKGADFAKAIPKVLRESDLFIVCLSTRSVKKRSFIQREINLALDILEEKLGDDLYIFPVRLEACIAPDRISKFNRTDLFGDEHEEEWESLLKALHYQAKQLGKKISAEPVISKAKFTETINGVPLEMILVPAGEFLMGSTEEHVKQALANAKKEDKDAKLEWFSREMPQHKVKLSPFYMGKYQLTQAQWKAVMGEELKPHFKGNDLPMESISWEDAQVFCQKISALTNKEYRLPSEAEWEYACRAGTTGDYAGSLDAMAWYGNNSGDKTHPVGQKQANKWGLYDMHGNVWEWCQDWYGAYGQSPATDPQGAGAGSLRVLRGGGWGSGAARCRAAFRFIYSPDFRGGALGFRLLRTAR